MICFLYFLPKKDLKGVLDGLYGISEGKICRFHRFSRINNYKEFRKYQIY